MCIVDFYDFFVMKTVFLNTVLNAKCIAVAARGGMETLRPALQRVYMTRASAYRDALKSFIGGYQEGIQQVMEEREESKSKQGSDPPKQ